MAPENARFSEKEKEEIRSIVFSAMNDYFKSKSLMGRNYLLSAAMIVGALAVIFGGIKSLLAWLGFSYMK